MISPIGLNQQNQINDPTLPIAKGESSLLRMQEAIVLVFQNISAYTGSIHIRIWEWLTSSTAQGFYCATIVTSICSFLFDVAHPLLGAGFGAIYYIVSTVLIKITVIEDNKYLSWAKDVLICTGTYAAVTALFIHILECSLTYPLGIALAVSACTSYLWIYLVEDTSDDGD